MCVCLKRKSTLTEKKDATPARYIAAENLVHSQYGSEPYHTDHLAVQVQVKAKIDILETC